MKAVSIAMLALSLAAPVWAQKMDCGKEFRVRVDRMMSEAQRPGSLAEAAMVNRTRYALQGYDACMKGDMKTARQLFERSQTAGR